LASLHSGSSARAIVVGAGLAGLAAAWRLRSAGCRVTVLERRAGPGGRLRGERVEGFDVDGSLQVLRSNDRHLPGWIREVGLADELLPLRPVTPAVWQRGTVRTTNASSALRVARAPGVRFHEGLRLVRLPRLMRRYRPTLDRDAPERAAAWDYRSVGDFARLYFGQSVVDYFAGPIASSALSGDANELSRVGFLLEWLAEEHGRFGVARRGLAELPAQASEALGVRLRTGAAEVEADGAGQVVRCEDGSRLEADIVVLATSASEARHLVASQLVPAERDFFATVRYAPEAVLVTALDRPPAGTPHFVRVPAVEGEIVEALLVEPGVADGRAPLGYGLATIAGNQAFCESSRGTSDEVVEKELAAALERIYPTVVGTIRFSALYRRRCAIPRFEVGAYRMLERFRRVQRDRCSLGRRLYFAGDYLSGLSADQVVGSGFRAAREALTDL
jgi:oxygen-dependent protoporphyrinogen oxidase